MEKVWWTVVVAVAVLSAYMQRPALLMMSLLLALIGGATYFWSRYSLAGVQYRRHFGSERLFHGEETDLHVEIVNAKPLPLIWLRAEDQFPASLRLLNAPLHSSHRPDRRSLINLVSLRWYERVTRHYRIQGTERGLWEFGPVDLISGDIFGFAMNRERIDHLQQILVYPRIVPITALGLLPARHPFGDYATSRRVIEDPIRLMGAREYVPGDNFRYIHWKATARRRTLQTKVFEPSASRPVTLFLNINTFDYRYEGLDRELQEYAITATASIARWVWEAGHPIGLYVNSVAQPEGQRIRVRPSGHPDQLLWILEALARVVMYGRWPIETILQVESTGLRFGTTVVVVTAVLNARLRETLLDLEQRGYGVVLIALGDARLEAPLPGIQYYHIGGRERWYALIRADTGPGEEREERHVDGLALD